jgi:prepilin-type N-terminal cleavage/methylation domain-containing protein
MKEERGFALVEILIAIAVLGIISAGFLGALGTASKALFTSDERATAESLARSQMEYVKNQDYDSGDPQSYEQTDVPSAQHPNYTTSVAAQALNNPDDGIQKITVTVKHSSVTIITLEDYKVNR